MFIKLDFCCIIPTKLVIPVNSYHIDVVGSNSDGAWDRISGAILRTVVSSAGSYPLYMAVTSLLSIQADAVILSACTVAISPLAENNIYIYIW